jgi:hypothetical protein
VTAAATLEPQTARFEASTIQEFLELIDHEFRQPTVFLHPLAKRWPVRGDRLVQHSLFRTAPLISFTPVRAIWSPLRAHSTNPRRACAQRLGHFTL